MRTLKGENNFFTVKHPASKVVFCPLVGAELSRALTDHAATPDQKKMVDEAVFEFNTEVFKINRARGTYSPPLHRTIHRSSGGQKKSYYHHLSDGVHLNEEQRLKWAEDLVKASSRN